MPEFIKKSQRNAKKKWVKRFYFCHVGRTGGRSIIWNFIQDGWDVVQDEKERPTREEVFHGYKSKRGTDRIMPQESFAIVRHPIARIESHVRWAIKNKKLDPRKECIFEFIENSIENMFEDELGRHIIPAFECVLFDSTVIQYELGFRNIADYLVQNKFVEKWKKNIRIREDGKVRFDWSKCPEKTRDIILKTYELDFENFDYDPFDFLKM